MLETTRIYKAAGVAVLIAGCATPEVVLPPVVTPPRVEATTPQLQPEALVQEAKALLAQAETDIQRARGKRALWLKAWESLVLARQATLAQDHAGTARHARHASELAELGLQQLAFPAVK